jgi:hypothetical protein
MFDIMNKYITDPEARKELHLDRPEQSLLDKIVNTFLLVLFAVMIVIIFINLLNA